MGRRAAILMVILILACSGLAQANIAATVHNLSLSGPGLIKSDIEDRVCVFCHTPHNANPAQGLWNHQLSSAPYDMYGSNISTEKWSLEYPSTAIPPAPTGSSKLCLSCHDGTVAIGLLNGFDPLETLISGKDGLDAEGRLVSSKKIGTNLQNDHPISIPISNPGFNELKMPTPGGPVRLQNGLVQCTSCHDPHNDATSFLVLSPDNGVLCEECHDHNINADLRFFNSAHALSAKVWPTNTDYEHPLYSQRKPVGQWACLGCHVMHGDDSASEAMPHLLRGRINPDPSNEIDSDKESGPCFNCHDGPVTVGAETVAPDIRSEFSKAYRHPIQSSVDQHYVKEFPNAYLTNLSAHVECVDCHDPHYVQSRQQVGLPSPRPIGEITAGSEIKGIRAWQFLGFSGQETIFGTDGSYLIQYEYELCLKCHGSKAKMIFSRAHMMHIDSYFNPNINQATHGAITPSGNRNPYVWNTATQLFKDHWLNQGFTWETGTLACCDCHGNDDTSDTRILGPHGSDWGAGTAGARWLLRKSGVTDSQGNDIVCYLCHDVNVYGPVVGTTRKNLPADAYRSGFIYHPIEQHTKPRVSYPPGVPPIPCFACHGDYSSLESDPTTGGLHGANPRPDRPDTTSGIHFLNGFAIEINSSDAELLATSGPITCGDTADQNGFGCTKHTTTETYTRPGL